MRTDIRYTPTDCFRPFRFPAGSRDDNVEQASDTRTSATTGTGSRSCATSGLGLTKTYNLFHDPNCADPQSRDAPPHAEMDQAVLACYGWQDIDLAARLLSQRPQEDTFHAFREAQREIFTRLLALNQEIAAQEAAAGLTPQPEPSDEEEEAGSDDE